MDFYLLNSAYRHLAGRRPPEQKPEAALEVLKNEEFAMQLLISADREFLAVAGRHMDIAWKGLLDKVRVDIQAQSQDEEARDLSHCFQLNLVEYVQDDEGNPVADILLTSPARLAVTADQLLYISGRIPSEFKGSKVNLWIRAYYSTGYADEKLIFETGVTIRAAAFSLPDVKGSEFYMDLWQQPCNWARAYAVPYYEGQHMEIIDHYLEGMSKLGQKVCDLILSDFPWAGQRCYKVEENAANLFELNIVRVKKDRQGKLCCDFRAMDSYLQIAEKHGMAEEINLFGILGNWDAFDFGNPLKDYRDPVRVSYFDEETASFRYLASKAELRDYLQLVFSHLQKLGLWERTLIMSDEPNNPKLFVEAEDLLQEAAGEAGIQIKCAIHDPGFFSEYGANIHSISLNTSQLVNNLAELGAISRRVSEKQGKTTWFSCCFPQQLNIFLKSPLIESRLIGWFTYYMELDGFLRWAYGIWPGDVYGTARYKPEKWAAGDMFIVYPGKDGRPMESIRLKNILYGIQDWLLLKAAEDALNKKTIFQHLEELLGKKDAMQYLGNHGVALNHSLDVSEYLEMRSWIIDALEKTEACDG